MHIYVHVLVRMNVEYSQIPTTRSTTCTVQIGDCADRIRSVAAWTRQLLRNAAVVAGQSQYSAETAACKCIVGRIRVIMSTLQHVHHLSGGYSCDATATRRRCGRRATLRASNGSRTSRSEVARRSHRSRVAVATSCNYVVTFHAVPVHRMLAIRILMIMRLAQPDVGLKSAFSPFYSFVIKSVCQIFTPRKYWATFYVTTYRDKTATL